MKSIEVYFKQPNIVSPFQEIVNDEQANTNPNFHMPEFNKVGSQIFEADLSQNPQGVALDLPLRPKDLVQGYDIVVKGIDGNDATYQQVIQQPPMRITDITANCAYDLAMTAFLKPDNTDLVNNGVIQVGNSQGKTLQLSLDYDRIAQTCPTITGGVHKIYIRDDDNQRQLQGAPVYIPSSDCTVSATMACTGNDPAQCTDNATPLDSCEIVKDDDENDNTVVIRCNTYDQVTGANTCVVNQLGNGNDPLFTTEQINSMLVDGLKDVMPNPKTDQYFDLSAEALATYGNYQADGVSLTFFSILEDQNEMLLSHKATYKFVVDQRVQPIQITNPDQKLLVEWENGKLRVPEATIDDTVIDPNNCGAVQAFLYQSVDNMMSPQKVTTQGISAAGDGLFESKMLFDLSVQRPGRFMLGYELTCGNDVYSKMHSQPVELLVQGNPGDLPCGQRPVIYGPNEARFTPPFNFGANLVELLSQVENKFYVTVESYDDPNCARIYDGEIAFMSLQAKPYMPCFLNNDCMDNVNENTLQYCSPDAEARFTCGDHTPNIAPLSDITCQFTATQGAQAVDVTCIAFEITDDQGVVTNKGAACTIDNNQASSCYIAKYDNEDLYDPGFMPWNMEANYYKEATYSSLGQQGVEFSPLMAQYKRSKDQTTGLTSPYLFTFYKGAGFNSVHMTKLEFVELEANFEKCTVDKQKRGDNEQIKNQYFQEFNQVIGDLTFGSDVVIPPMNRQFCELYYGIAERGYCNLQFVTQDKVSQNSEKRIGYGTIAKFMMEQANSDDGPYYFALSATCNDNGVYSYHTYEHEMVKFGSIIPSDYERDETEEYQVTVNVYNSAGASLRNQMLGSPEIVVGEYNTPEQEQLEVRIKVDKFPETTFDFEIIKSQTVKLSFDDELAALRNFDPNVYGQSPMQYTQVQSDVAFDCQVVSLTEVTCTANQLPVVGDCKVFSGLTTANQRVNLGGCCIPALQQCIMDVEANTPGTVTFLDSLAASFSDAYNQVIANSQVMYGDDESEIKFNLNLKDLVDNIDEQSDYDVKDIYLFLTVMNTQTGASRRHKIHVDLVFNNDPCPQGVADNREMLQNAMDLHQPVVTMIKWGQPVEVHASSIDAHTLTARIAHRSDANCATIADVGCGDIEISEDNSKMYDFSAVKTCIEEFTPQADGKYIIQIEASKNGQVAYTYLSSRIQLLPPGADRRAEGTCFMLIEKLADATGVLKNPNFNEEYEIDLNGNEDATVSLEIEVAGLNAQTCNYELYNLQIKTFGDLQKGTGAGGQVYSSQCAILPPGLECFDVAGLGKQCEYQRVPVQCKQGQVESIDYMQCRTEDKFGNTLCGIWVSEEYQDGFSLPQDPGFLETQSYFNDADEPVFNEVTKVYTFTAANVKTLLATAGQNGDYVSKFYAHAIVKNVDDGELVYVRSGFTIKFYNQGTICSLEKMFADQATQVQIDANGDLILMDDQQQVVANIDVQDDMNLIADLQAGLPLNVNAQLLQNGQLSTEMTMTTQVVCFDYPSCSFLPQQNFASPNAANEVQITYSYAEALDILAMDENCFINFKVLDTAQNQNNVYYSRKIHLKMPAPPLQSEGISFTIGYSLGTQTVDHTATDILFNIDLTQDPTIAELALNTVFTPLQGSPEITRCVFTTFTDLQNFEKLAAESADGFPNSCHRMYAPTAACDIQGTKQCTVGQDTYDNCAEVTDLEGNTHYNCPFQEFEIPTCVILFTTKPYPEDQEMFERTAEEIKAKSPYNDAIGDATQTCGLIINIGVLTGLWERQPYQNSKTLEFYASYLATEADGTEKFVQRGPIQIQFTRPEPPISTEPSNFIVERFSELIPYKADQAELEVDIYIDTSKPIFTGKSLALKISLYKDDREVEMFNAGTASYSGAPFNYLTIAKHAGAILADDDSQRANIYFKLSAIDTSSGNVLATVDSERVILLPPMTAPIYQATDCVIDTLSFEINGAAAPQDQVQNTATVLVKELTPASDGNDAVYENVKVTYSASSQNCANVEHECKLLPFSTPNALGAYSRQIFFNAALCDYVDPSDSAFEYTTVPGGQGLVHLKDSNGNVRLGLTTPQVGYELFREPESGYCAVVSTNPDIMGQLEQSLGQQEVMLLKDKTLEGFKVSGELAYDINAGALHPQFTGMTQLFYHCISKEITTGQDGSGNPVTTLSSLKYNRVPATIVYETSIKLVHQSETKMVHFGKNLYAPQLSLTPYFAQFQTVQIEELYLALYNHETQTYTKFEATKKTIQMTAIMTSDVFLPYDDLLSLQAQNVGFYELQAYAKYELMFVAVIKDTTTDETSEELIGGDVVAMPPYIMENDLLTEYAFNIQKPVSSNAVTYTEDLYGRPTFSIYDVQSNMDKNYTVEVDFTNESENILVGFHVNNRKALSYYCTNSYRWQQDPSQSSCVDFPVPDCEKSQFSKEQCNLRTGECDSEVGTLTNCMLRYASMDDLFIKCSYGQKCVTQPTSVQFDNNQPLFQLGDLYNFAAEGEKKASSVFQPQDVAEHFNIPEGEQPKPFYAHTIFKRAVAGSDPVQYTYHYAMLEFMLIGQQTVLELTIESAVGAGDLAAIPDTKILETGFNEAVTIKATITSASVEDITEWELTGGVLEAFSGQTGSTSFFFEKEFGSGFGTFEETITQADILKYIGFREPRFGFSGRNIAATGSNIVSQIDGFTWKVAVPTNGDKDDTLACLSFDITMYNVRDLEEGKDAHTMIPESYGFKSMMFQVVNDNCANNAQYYLQAMEISKEDDLNTQNDSPANRFFRNIPLYIPEDTTQENYVTLEIDELVKLQQTDMANNVLAYKIHAIFIDANGAAVYVIRDLAFDFSSLGALGNDYNCDGSFSSFQMYMYLNSWKTNEESIMETCDTLSQKKGGQLQYFEWEFNQPMKFILVPELLQCGGNTDDYYPRQDNNGQTYFDWEGAKNNVFTDEAKTQAYERLRSGWFILRPGCDTCEVAVESDMTVTLSPVQQMQFMEGFEAELENTVLLLCNYEYMTSDCIPFFMPRVKAPMPMDPSQYSQFTRLTRARQESTGGVTDIVIEPQASGAYEINTNFALKFTLLDGTCNNALDGEFRTFADLSKEDSMRGMRGGDQEKDMDCEIIPMRYVDQNNQQYYEDASFKRYPASACTTEQDQNQQAVVRCTETTARGEKKCYFMSRTVKHPQDTNLFGDCYIQANFADCPVSGRCVACRASAKIDPESCEPDKTPQPGECPPETSQDCEEYENYMHQVNEESIRMSNSMFQPKSNLNKLLRDGEFTENSVTFQPYSQAPEYQSKDNKHNGASAPTPAADFPGQANEVYAHVFCEGENGQVDYKVQKFVFVEQTVHPSASDYSIKLNFRQQLSYKDTMSFTPGVASPNSNYFLTTMFKTEFTTIPFEPQNFNAFTKYNVISYRRKSEYSVSMLLEANNAVVDRKEVSVQIAPPPISERVTQGIFANPRVEMLQRGNPVGQDEFSMLIKKDYDIVGTVSFRNPDDSVAGRVGEIVIRNFEDLNQECAFNGLCPATQNDFCESIPMYCDSVAGHLICYGLNMNRIEGNCREVDDGCTIDNRCDMVMTNSFTNEQTHSCYTAKKEYVESVNEIMSTHPLDLPACQYTQQQQPTDQNQGCPRTKACITAMMAVPGMTTPTGLPDTSPCYEAFEPIVRELTCKESKMREEINDALDSPLKLIQSRNDDGTLTFTLKHETWQPLVGSYEHFFMTIFFENSQGQMQYTVVDEVLQFLTYSEDKAYAPEVQFAAKRECQAVPFNQPYDIAVSIEDYVAQNSPAGYKIQKSVVGRSAVTIHQHGDTVQIPYRDLYDAYGKINRENTCEMEILNFNVFDSTNVEFNKSPAKLVLQYPQEADMSQDGPNNNQCHQVTTAFKDMNGAAVKVSATSRPMVNINKEITLEITHNFGDNCGATGERNIKQVILSKNSDLHAAAAEYRRSYAQAPDYACHVTPLHDLGNGKCVTLLGNEVDCTTVTDSDQKETKRVNLNRETCLLKDPDLSHPLDDQSSALRDCYTLGSSCFDNTINTDCLLKLQFMENPTLTPPADSVFQLECDELEQKIREYVQNNSVCSGNQSPEDKFNFGDTPDKYAENYLRSTITISTVKIPNTKNFKTVMKLPPDNSRDIGAGDATIYIHTLYEKILNSGTANQAITIEYSPHAVDLELVKISAQPPTQSSITHSASLAFGEGLKVTDDLSTSDPSAQEVLQLVLLDTETCQDNTYTLTDDNPPTSKSVTVPYQELVECYSDEFTSAGFKARGKVLKKSSGDIFAEKEIEFSVQPPKTADYSTCDDLLTASLVYTSDQQAVQTDGSNFLIENAYLNDPSLQITLTGKTAQTFTSYFAYAVGPDDLSSYSTAQNKESAMPETLYCEDQGTTEGDIFTCYDMDKENKYESCQTSSGCTYCETPSGAISRDTNNPHPQTIAQYADCYDPAKRANCPVLAYCLDRQMSAEQIFTPQNVLSYPLMDSVHAFHLYEKWPMINWEELAQQIENLSTQEKSDILVRNCIDLQGMILEQQQYWYTPCEELYYKTSNDQYHPFLKEQAPAYCDDGSNLPTNNVPINQIAAFESLNHALSLSSRTGNDEVLVLDKEFIQLLFSNPNNAPNSLEFQIIVLGEKNTNAQVCRTAISLSFETPPVEVKLWHPDTREGETYSTLDYYYFEGRASDLNPSSTNSLSCYFECTPAQLCPSAQQGATSQQFELTDEDLAFISGTQSFTIKYKCDVTDMSTSNQSTEESTTHTINFEAQSFEEVCEVEMKDDYKFIYDDGVTRPVYLIWTEDQRQICSYTGAVMKIRETGANCAFCGVTTRNNVITKSGDTSRKVATISSANIPLNVEYNIDLEISYDITINGSPVSKKAVLRFTIYRYKEISFSCNINDYMYFKGQAITNSLVSSDASITNFSVLQWTCPTWVNPNLCNSLTTSYSFSGTALSPLNIPDGDYEFCASILYSGVADYYACCEFSYVNENVGTSTKRAFKVQFEYPVGANKESVKNFDLGFRVSSLTGTSSDIFTYDSFTWKLQQRNDAGQFVDMQVDPIVGQDAFSYIEEGSLSPNKRYKVVATAVLADGSTTSNQMEFKTANILAAGKVRVESMTAGSNQLTSTTNLKIILDGFQGVEEAEILYREKGSSGEPKTALFAYESVIENVRLPPTDQYDIWVDYIDANGWFQTASITATITVGAAFQSVDEAITGLDLGSLANQKDELEALFPNEDIMGRMKQEFLSNFATEKNTIQIDQNTVDPGKVADVLDNVASMLELLGADEEVVNFVENDLVTLVERAFDSSTGASEKLQESSIEKVYKISAELDASTTSTDNIKSQIKKKLLTHVHGKGSLSINQPNSQMTGKKFDMTNMRSSGSLNIKQSSTTNLPSSEIDLDASTFKSKADNLGTTALSVSSSCKTLPSNTINAIADGTSYINKQVELEFSDGTNIIDGTGITANLKFDASTTVPRNLATVTTTVTNPVCYRYDAASTSWTTTGVTTVDNGSSVSCTTSMPGAIQVQYITTTTTTTTPDPTSTSSTSSSNVGLIVGLVVGLVVVAVAITLTIIFVKKAQKKRKMRRQSRSTPMFIQDNTASIKEDKYMPQEPHKKKFSVKGQFNPTGTGSTNANVVDASVTEMRPMAADDSYEKPSEGPISIIPAPAGRRSYAKVQDSEEKSIDRTEDEIFQRTNPEANITEENKSTSPDLKLKTPQLIPEEPDNVPERQPDIKMEPQNEPNQMEISQPDIGSDHGSGKGLLGGVPESDLKVEDA